jgi:hypothetical protein
MIFSRENLTKRDVGKGLSFPQMEMHNGMKPFIVLGVTNIFSKGRQVTGLRSIKQYSKSRAAWTK